MAADEADLPAQRPRRSRSLTEAGSARDAEDHRFRDQSIRWTATSLRSAPFAIVAEKYNALTYLDEVHAVGLYGPRGGGVAERDGVMHRMTSSRARWPRPSASWAAISPARAALRSCAFYAPGFIFTTSLPPAIAAGALASDPAFEVEPRRTQRHQERARSLKRRRPRPVCR